MTALARVRKGPRQGKVSAQRAPGDARLWPLAYIAPGALLYATFVLVPLGVGIWLSFYRWDGVGTKKWVGLGNYTALLSDSSVRESFVHSGVLVGFYCVLPVILGLAVSACIARVRPRGFTALRTLLFLPQIIPLVAIGVSWQWIFAYNGPLNKLLHLLGLGALAKPWLGDFQWALPSVGVIGTWIMLGLCIVLFMSGIQTIPRSLYDAARADGAGAWREFWLVTLPGLRQEVSIVVTITVITALRAFAVIYVTTMGGPGQSTQTPSLLIYLQAFDTGNVGYAAALAVCLTAVVFVVGFGVSKLADARS